MQATDLELVQAVLGGSTERFGELVKRHDRRIRATVFERLGEVNDELVHQTFYLAFMNLARLEDPARFEPWLVRISVRCCAEHVRERVRRREQGLAGNEVSAGMGEPRAWVWDEVERLPPAFSEVLVLRYRNGQSYAEIARLLALPVSTVRGRIYEARRALRLRLENGADREGWS
jgi:RNA polymerase sigma-70 factor (ECF subfamily)